MSTAIELYLIRHGLAGEAGSYPNDDERPLTEEGKKKTRQVAKRLSDLDLQFDQMLTSPLVRARQTADILLEVGLSATLDVSNDLATGDLHHWLQWFQSWQPGKNGKLALVGHEPSLSTWAEYLTFGQSKGALQLKKAGIIGISVPDQQDVVGRGVIVWLTPPRFLIPE
jgi:phosphohistidine phosphatase